MDNNRIFAPEELRRLETPLADLIVEAIDKGQYEKAKRLAGQIENEYVPIMYMLEDFVASLTSYIYEADGVESVEKSLRFSADRVMKMFFDGLINLGTRETIEYMSTFFRAHSGKGLTIEEDDEKITLVLNICGSGGRMVKEGAFGPPKNLRKIKDPASITFGRKEWPTYCAHCAVFHQIVPIEWVGWPYPPIEIGNGPGDPCKWHFYKDPAAIPARYYEQVGKQKKA